MRLHILTVAVFALGLALAGSAAQACTLERTANGYNVMGFTVYPTVLWTTTGPSGRILGAYIGHYEPSLEACISSCVADSGCAGVTYRTPGTTGNTCLRFARTDFETGETGRRFRSNPGMMGHNSAIIRTAGGQLCN